MTSIERAMDKIDRPAGEPADSVTEVASVPAEAASPAAQPTQSAAPTAAPKTVAPPIRDPQAQATPKRKTAKSERTATATATAPAHRIDLPPGQGNTQTKNYIALQEDRLAAGGFLTPNGGRTRQQEEYQQIKRRLLGNLVPGMAPTENPPNLIMVTSSVPSEGKTFTSSNLAISIAMEIDHTVLAVDTDIVKSDMSGTFGLRNRKGLFDLLGDPTLRMEDLLVRTSIPNLVVLPAGTHGKFSTEYLASGFMKELLAEMATRYPDRIVLFDSPPILATTTAAALAKLVGQLVLVVEAGKTKQETLREALMQIEGIPITGLILNKIKQSVAGGYGYYGYYGYGYGYGEEPRD